MKSGSVIIYRIIQVDPNALGQCENDVIDKKLLFRLHFAS